MFPETSILDGATDIATKCLSLKNLANFKLYLCSNETVIVNLEIVNSNQVYSKLNTRLSFKILYLCFYPFLLIGQGYYNQENFGNSSLLLSGNVTGSVVDLGMTYYNPARLALVENPIFSINAKAYQVNKVNVKNIFGVNETLSDSRFEGVPSLVAGTFDIEKWKNHNFAYAFISKQRSRLNINISREANTEERFREVEEIERFVSDLKFSNKETDEWFGISWGTKLGENFSIGVSTFVSVYNFEGSWDLRFASLDNEENGGLSVNEIKLSQTSYGIFWKVGLAWKLDKIDLGLNLDLPYLEVIGNGKFRYQNFLLLGINSEENEFEYYDFKDLTSKRKEPLGISIGAGFLLGKNKIHIKTDWHDKVSEYDRIVFPPIENGVEGFAFKEELRSVINFGIGGEIYLTGWLNLYASFSTDFSPIKTGAELFDFVDGGETDASFDSDYFHYGLGAEFKLKKVQLVMGMIYSSASNKYNKLVEVPQLNIQPTTNDDLAKITVSRSRFVIGLEIPIFGYKLEVK